MIIRTKVQRAQVYDTCALDMQIPKLVILLPSLSSMTAAPQQTQIFLKLYIFIQDLQWPSFFRLSSPQRKDQICVLYIEGKKKEVVAADRQCHMYLSTVDEESFKSCHKYSNEIFQTQQKYQK